MVITPGSILTRLGWLQRIDMKILLNTLLILVPRYIFIQKVTDHLLILGVMFFGLLFKELNATAA